MTSPIFNFGGIATGLPTNDIVEQLMAIERNPIALMNQRRQTAQTKVDAFSSITTQFSAMRDAVNSLRDRSDFSDFSTATSSNSEAVSVSTQGGATPSSLAFTVDRLATAHQMVGSTSFTSASDTVGAGTLTLSVNGVDHDFATTAGTSLAGLVDQINRADIGVSATALAVDGSTTKLVLTSNETGESNSFTAAGTQTGLTGFDLVSQGADAELTVGSGAGALSVRRASNTIDDLIPGVSMTLNDTTTSAVQVDVARDTDAMVTKVTELVDSLNGVLAEMDRLTAYDAENDRASALTGDATVRTITGNLVNTVTSVVDSLTSSFSFAGSVGLEYTTENRFELDADKLREALNQDWDGVVDLFARSGSADDARASFSFATDSTTAGSYDVQVTQAATIAQTTGSFYVAPAADTTLEISVGEQTVSATIAAGDSLAAAVERINGALAEAGVNSLQASESGGALRLASQRYGSGGSFSVTGSATLGLDGSHTGLDVAGTIDGVAAEGQGQTLRSTSGASEGLGIAISATQSEISAAGGTLNLGSMSYSRGLMGELSDLLSQVEGTDGSLARAADRWKSQIDTIDDQIDRYEDRLELRERTLRRQFTAMENAVSNLQGQASFLFSGLGQ